MASPDVLLKATVSRLAARLGHGLAEAAAEMAVLAQDAPERLKREWDLFQEEVQAEAERLERDGGEEQEASPSPSSTAVDAPSQSSGAVETPQQQIDRLRAKVADLSTRMEGGV